MPQYLVASYLPDNFDPSTVTEAMIEEIHALNREMIAAGVRKFACGMAPAANTKTVRKQSNGKVLVTDGPYLETKEHIGGFWILEAANMDEALAWARKGAISCDAVGEVRELLFFPAPEKGGFSQTELSPILRRMDIGEHPLRYPRRAASILATSIFFICIMASKARFASAPPAASASVSGRGVICQERPQRSLHQPQALSCPPLPTIAFQ
jgi:hypothetical protein